MAHENRSSNSEQDRPPGFPNLNMETGKPYVVPPHMIAGYTQADLDAFDYDRYAEAQRTGDFSYYKDKGVEDG